MARCPLGPKADGRLLTIRQLLTIEMWTLAVLKAEGPLEAATKMTVPFFAQVIEHYDSEFR